MIRKFESVEEAYQALVHERAIQVAQFTNGQVRDVVDLLGGLLGELDETIGARLANISARGPDVDFRSTKRLQALRATITDLVSETIREARAVALPDLRRFGVVEAKWAVQALTDTYPFQLATTVPPAPLLRSLVTSRPFEGALWGDHWTGLEAVTRRNIEREVLRGITSGEGHEQIVRRLRGTRANGYRGVWKTTKQHAATVVRTAANHVSAQARVETAKENRRLIRSERFIATLDARTTDICFSLHGREFAIGEGDIPPMHMRCRSTRSPVPFSFRDLGIDVDDPQFTIAARQYDDPFSATVRRVKDTTTTETYLRNQPRSVVEKALGKGKAEVFLNGRVPLSRFVDRELNPLRLDELIELDRRAAAAGRRLPEFQRPGQVPRKSG
ncbi:MAG: minor capsid protein [Planctomycetota bacterium JB042]